jgi:hypothetical protein
MQVFFWAIFREALFPDGKASKQQAALDTLRLRRYRRPMAQSILIFDFGTNEEAAQQARHKIEAWQQGMRLGKKMLFKFEREESTQPVAADAASDSAETAAKAKAPKKKKSAGGNSKQKAGADGADAAPAGRIRLLVRLWFSDHEKLTQQRLIDRLVAEDPFKSIQGETVSQGSSSFAETADRFDSLD